jgi:outer membrane protein insertion porin family
MVIPAIVLSVPYAVPARADMFQQVAPKINEIVVLGNKALNKESIISSSGLKVGDVATPAVLEAAQRSLLATGNFGMRRINNPEEAVKLSVTDVNPATNEGKLLIQVEENDVVQGFNITGNGPIPPKDVQAQLQTKPGFVLNINTLRADVDRIQKYYDSKGYIANVSEEGFGLTNGILDIPIVVGKVGAVNVKGLVKTKKKVVTREMRLKPGEYYNVNTFKKDYTRLFNTDLFEDIQPAILTPRPGVVDLTMNMTEKRTGQVGLSIGYSSRGGIIGRAEVGENNFLGLGDQINLMIERSGLTNRTGAEVGFTEPWLDRRHTSLSVSIYDRVVYRFGQSLESQIGGNNLNNNTDYYEIHEGAQITLSRPFTDQVRGYLGLRYDNVRVPLLGQLNPSDAAILQNGPLATITLRGTNNTRDYDQDPAAGGFDTATLDIGRADLKAVTSGAQVLNPVVGVLNYQKYSVDSRRYFSPKGPRKNPKDKRNVFALRLMIGTSSGTLPFSEQYFVGGAESLRGYQEDRFWGKNMMLGSFEFRTPLAPSLTGVLFTDVGDAWGGSYEKVHFNGFNQHSGFSPSVGIGLGMRVVTPIGPIRIDEGFGREGARTHFSIGHVF